jgi:hypothetical protein
MQKMQMRFAQTAQQKKDINKKQKQKNKNKHTLEQLASYA